MKIYELCIKLICKSGLAAFEHVLRSSDHAWRKTDLDSLIRFDFGEVGLWVNRLSKPEWLVIETLSASALRVQNSKYNPIKRTFFCVWKEAAIFVAGRKDT